MGEPIQYSTQPDLWGSDDYVNSTMPDPPDKSEEMQEQCKGKETLISAWTLFLKGGILLEVGTSLENFFDPTVLICCPQYENCYLRFERKEWHETFSFKTEHLIRQMLQCIPNALGKHEIWIQPDLKIETEEEGDDNRCIRISQSERSILFSKQAIEALFSATDVINQKMDLAGDYAKYCLYDDFTRALTEILKTEGVHDEESILSRGKFVCKNFKLLTSLISWEHKHNLGDFTMLTEIINIHPQKFINTIVNKLKWL